MTDDRFEDFVRRAEQAERKAELARRPPARVVWVRWGLAAAAVLALGIGIGVEMGPRLTRPSRLAEQAAAAPAREQIPAAFQIVALDHLRHVETFLSVFQSEARQGSVEQMPELARSLLENTRLLMDSPAGRDAHMAAVLDDIEVVLAQIASYSGGDGSELTLIEQGIERRGVLLKLHAAIPAKYGVASAQGVL